tara:strand:+ start:368 stop:532 length:165 start_codon:yes stop_codon:yes gene_type:complete
MHCIYINLDPAVDSREAVEENFRETMAPPSSSGRKAMRTNLPTAYRDEACGIPS